MSDTLDRRAVIERTWQAAWDHGDVGALDTLLSPAYRRRSGTSGDSQDLETFKASIISTRAAFPDMTTTIDEIIVDGDRAAVRWHSAGNHTQSFLGVPATGKAVEISGATFARFESDHIVEEFVTWDPRSLLSALGIISVGQDN